MAPLERTVVDAGRLPWSTVPIGRIEDLRDAVLGAGLEAVQMNRGTVTGGLAFAERRGIVFTSGRIEGDVNLVGPLSEDHVTLGLGLRIPPGSWHWYEPVATGSVGVFRAGDTHDSRYRPGSLYAAATLSLEQLEAEAAEHDLVLDAATLGRSGFRRERLAEPRLASVRNDLDRIHLGRAASGDPCEALLHLLIEQCARTPRTLAGARATPNYARIVARARDYIAANLQEPIRVEDIAKAAMTSQRTLYRAFLELIGDPPQNYVRRLRLHRIRRDLVSDAEAACTITMTAHQWGIAEPGRLSGWYRDLFGELPSETVTLQRSGNGLTE